MHHHSLSTFQYPDNPNTDNVVFITGTTRLILILVCFNNNNNRHHAAAHPGGRGVPRGDPPHLRQPRRHHRGRGRHAPPLRRGPGELWLVDMAAMLSADWLTQEVFPDGLVAGDGRLQPGDQIIEINGTDMTCATHSQVRQRDMTWHYIMWTQPPCQWMQWLTWSHHFYCLVSLVTCVAGLVYNITSTSQQWVSEPGAIRLTCVRWPVHNVASNNRITISSTATLFIMSRGSGACVCVCGLLYHTVNWCFNLFAKSGHLLSLFVWRIKHFICFICCLVYFYLHWNINLSLPKLNKIWKMIPNF